MSFIVGDRVKAVTKDYPNGIHGIARFIGPTQFASDIWVGIELSVPGGKNNGTVQNIEYFKCDSLHGQFVKQVSVFPGTPVTSPVISSVKKDALKDEDSTPFGLESEESSDDDLGQLHDIESLRMEIVSQKQEKTVLTRTVARLEGERADNMDEEQMRREFALLKHRYEMSVADLDAVLEEVGMLEEDKKFLQSKYDALLKDNSAQAWESQLVKMYSRVTLLESNEVKLKRYIDDMTGLLREQAAVLADYDVLEKENSSAEEALRDANRALEERVQRLETEREHYELRIARQKSEGRDVAAEEQSEQLDLVSRERELRLDAAEERQTQFQQREACFRSSKLSAGRAVSTNVVLPSSINLINQREESYDYALGVIKTLPPVVFTPNSPEAEPDYVQLARAMTSRLFLASTVAVHSVASFVALSGYSSLQEKRLALQTAQSPEQPRLFFLLQSALMGVAALCALDTEEHCTLTVICHHVLGSLVMDPTSAGNSTALAHLVTLLSDACRTNLGFQVNLYQGKFVMVHGLTQDNCSLESNTFTLLDFTHYIQQYIRDNTLPRELALLCQSSELLLHCQESLRCMLWNLCLCLRILDGLVPTKVELVYAELVSCVHEFQGKIFSLSASQYTALSVLYMLAKLSVQILLTSQRSTEVDQFCMELIDLLPSVQFKIEIGAILGAVVTSTTAAETGVARITVVEGCSREEEAALRAEIQELQKQVRGLTSFVSTVGSNTAVTSTPTRPQHPAVVANADPSIVLQLKTTATLLTSKTRAYLSQLQTELGTLKLQNSETSHNHTKTAKSNNTPLFPLVVTEHKTEMVKSVTQRNVQSALDSLLYSPRLITLDENCIASCRTTWSTEIQSLHLLLDRVE